MKTIIIIISFFFVHCSYAKCNKQTKIKEGSWLAELKLNNEDVLPFNLSVEKTGKEYVFCVVNGEEKIELITPKTKGDSVFVRFPFFNSELIFKVINKETINGYWVNYNKGFNYKIPFNAKLSSCNRFSCDEQLESTNLSGKWEVNFEPHTPSSYPALGLFNQVDGSNIITGTFLTETGDYRFLAGNTTKDSMYLSCFDGSHAFLFKAALTEDSLIGTFNSGSHWKSVWKGVRNPSFELKSPEELTYLKEGGEFSFNLKSLNGTDFNFPNEDYKDKVVIIQIMGTWCPNCLDETMFYKTLDEKYKDKGLEIISIGFETGKSFEDYSNNISRLKKRLGLEFTFLVGGPAVKDLASEKFNMLSSIISFPTSIFIDRGGNVVRVHTGFNGPGTGEYYENYASSTIILIESLLAD